MEVSKAIHLFVRSKLTDQQIDELWMKILQAPEYLEYLITEVNLIDLYRNKPKNEPT